MSWSEKIGVVQIEIQVLNDVLKIVPDNVEIQLKLRRKNEQLRFFQFKKETTKEEEQEKPKPKEDPSTPKRRGKSYTDHDRREALKKLRQCMSKGYSLHRAAGKIAHQTGIGPVTLKTWNKRFRPEDL